MSIEQLLELAVEAENLNWHAMANAFLRKALRQEEVARDKHLEACSRAWYAQEFPCKY